MHDTIRHTGEELAALRAAFQLVRDAVFVVDVRLACVVDANAAACRLLRVERGELVGRAWSDVVPQLGSVTLCEVGPRLLVGVVALPPSGGAQAADVPRDALTGLAGREALLARAATDTGGKRPARLAVMFIDLDGFKQVNDRCGHLAGDRVLRIVAERLTESIRPGDLIVRYGGDEFVVLVEGMTRRRDLERLARRIGRAVRRPIVVDGQDVALSASIGIAQRKPSAPTIDALIANADRAMYRVKFRRRDAQSSLLKPNSRQG